jgi:2-isopropylmalate synthase
VHCHDDLGLAVANTLAGVQAGARQVECAINGIGERAGNASLEEFVMLLATRAAHLGYTTGVNTREIARTSRMVSRLTGYPVQPNKAIVGRNAFAHESASTRTACSRSARRTRSWTPRRSGSRATTSCSASTPGRHALKSALQELGFQVDGQALNTAFKRFKEIADRKKTSARWTSRRS